MIKVIVANKLAQHSFQRKNAPQHITCNNVVFSPNGSSQFLTKTSSIQICCSSNNKLFKKNQFRCSQSRFQAGVSDVEELNNEEPIDLAPLRGKVNVFVERTFAINLEEGSKSLEEYVTLPAKKYSVLDSEAVQKLGGNKFRVSAGQQNYMMGQSGEPVGIIEIEIGDGFVEQRLSSAEIVNPKGMMMKQMNSVLSKVRMTNVIAAEDLPEDRATEQEKKQITCKVGIEAAFDEGPMSKVPEGRLNGLVGTSLGVVLPWFLTKLKEDYVLWASDKEELRGKMGKGEMKDISAGMMKTLQKGTLPEGVYEVKEGGRPDEN
eukprot:CAMPEP_0196579694 /NCGR_PEP_ID=MMETSP1081-20130531/24455_1 /TAXON_ID=36882 /ORGANISM="Pyramimonas amylifera, Strain CCMP720" /LENGTH=318 /DNA_ID=CAMNT_0041899349 /DNA_START=64 /DNA_END=1020 /DNA_ORIENTATION=-